eukprot:scaffold43875_cov34-Tisochrysis_lutea.AAC.2
MKRSAGMSVVAVSGSSQTARRIVDRATEKSEEAPRVSPDNQSILQGGMMRGWSGSDDMGLGTARPAG